MRPSEKYSVPADIKLLYDFVNSLDLRSFVEQGALHAGGDELATPQQLAQWLRRRGLLRRGASVSTRDYEHAVELRAAIRSFIAVEPPSRVNVKRVSRALTHASAPYPLIVQAQGDGHLDLYPAAGSRNGLANVVSELHALAQTDRLDRLKVCASDECAWVFYDRSKPANRRWCSSTLCGNRAKTRHYRRRQHAAKLVSPGE